MGRYEWLSGKAGAAQKSWAQALDRAIDSGMRYEEGMIHLEIGRRTGDRDELLQAESILEKIGAKFDLAAARKALDNFPLA